MTFHVMTAVVPILAARQKILVTLYTMMYLTPWERTIKENLNLQKR